MCPPPLPSLFWSPDIPGTLWMHVPISPHVYTIPQCIYIIYMTAFPCPSKPFSFGSNIDQEFHIAQHAGHVKAYYWHRMKYNIHIKRSIEEIESNKEELMKYLSSPLSNSPVQNRRFSDDPGFASGVIPISNWARESTLNHCQFWTARFKCLASTSMHLGTSDRSSFKLQSSLSISYCPW